MKKSAVTFACLRELLLGLQFTESRVPGSHISFEHPPSSTILMFRTYRPQERVTEADFITVRRMLEEKRLMTREQFEQKLLEAAA